MLGFCTLGGCCMRRVSLHPKGNTRSASLAFSASAAVVYMRLERRPARVYAVIQAVRHDVSLIAKWGGLGRHDEQKNGNG